MAWIFGLSAECGRDAAAAEAFAAHFEGQVFTRKDGMHHSLGGQIYEVPQEGYWCTITPSDVSRIGVSSEKDQREMDELALLFYERLKTVPVFRYALVAVEGESFREFSELGRDLVERDFNGLVISDGIWRSLGAPEIFVPFRAGYRWRPFISVR